MQPTNHLSHDRAYLGGAGTMSPMPSYRNSNPTGGHRPTLPVPYFVHGEGTLPHCVVDTLIDISMSSSALQRQKRSAEEAGLDDHSIWPRDLSPGLGNNPYPFDWLADDPVEGGANASGHHTTTYDDFGTEEDSASPMPMFGDGWEYGEDFDLGINDQQASIDHAGYPGTTSALDDFDNPFLLNTFEGDGRYDVHRRKHSLVAPVGEVDGYIKISTGSLVSELRELPDRRMVRYSPQLHLSGSGSIGIPRIPSLGLYIEAVDAFLLDFYIHAFCAGRTLLQKTNAFRDILSMVDGSNCVTHCVLALSASYVLDFNPSNVQMKKRADEHYDRAVSLLTDGLANLNAGNINSTVGSLILLLSDDIVNWELRDQGNTELRNPRWQKGARIARQILDKYDSTQKYYELENAQVDSITASIMNMVAFIEICALPVAPLEVSDLERPYLWLLAGSSKRDVMRIHGATGVSPKLLHTVALITQLAALSQENPQSRWCPAAVEQIRQNLESITQWSDVPYEGYRSNHDLEAYNNMTVHELLDRCRQICQGAGTSLVDDAMLVTYLTAHTWVQAAKIYLNCRLLRRPYTHKTVQDSLRILLRCLERMPTSGRLFTAQSPFFCVFIAATVAYRDPDRKVIRDWFEGVLSRSKIRSSVPPVWDAVQDYWEWRDDDDEASEGRGPSASPSQDPWWEVMVDKFMRTKGQLSLV